MELDEGKASSSTSAIDDELYYVPVSLPARRSGFSFCSPLAFDWLLLSGRDRNSLSFTVEEQQEDDDVAGGGEEELTGRDSEDSGRRRAPYGLGDLRGASLFSVTEDAASAVSSAKQEEEWRWRSEYQERVVVTPAASRELKLQRCSVDSNQIGRRRLPLLAGDTEGFVSLVLRR